MPTFTDFLEKQAIVWSTSEERRASPRYPADVRVLCRLLTGDPVPPTWKVRVRDLSTFGVGLILPQAPGLGHVLETELVRKNGTPVCTVAARVVHIERQWRKEFVVGCAFIKELTDEHLRFLQAAAIRPSGPDCRRWTRFPCNVETACYSRDTAPGERHLGRILNISAGGIGLRLRCQFSKGTLLKFDLHHELNLAPPILVRVVRVKDRGDGNWLLGCEFAHELREDQLRSLLR